MDFRQLNDIHTHQEGRSDALLSLMPGRDPIPAATPFSLSLHPWFLDEGSIGLFREALCRFQDHPLLMGIGESGLDNRCQTPLPLQHEAFLLSLQAARDLRLPLIIHCVGLWGEMQQDVRQVWGAQGAQVAYDADSPLIIHGFRKGPQLARQLLDAGFCLSLGQHFHPEIADLIPPERLFHETDEAR